MCYNAIPKNLLVFITLAVAVVKLVVVLPAVVGIHVAALECLHEHVLVALAKLSKAAWNDRSVSIGHIAN